MASIAPLLRNKLWLCCIIIVSMWVSKVHSSGIEYDVIYWEAPPFIYTDKATGQVRGILVEAAEYIRGNCIFDGPPFKPILNLRNYTTFRRYFDNKDKNINLTANAAWFPVFQKIEKNPREISELVPVDSLSVITRRDEIEFTYKVYIGLIESPSLYITAILMLLTLSILTWSCEKRLVVNDGFHKGNTTSLWLNCVTMVTVGYGDVVPLTIPGRFLNVIWMICSLITASLLTSIMWGAIINIQHLGVKDQRVAALENSIEADIVAKNWNATIQGYESYEEILEAIRRGDVKLAVLNSLTAGYYQGVMNDDPTRPALALVNTLKFDMMVQIFMSFLTTTPQKEDVFCYLREHVIGMNNAVTKSARNVQSQKIYYPSVEEILGRLSSPYTVCGLYVLVLFGLGICFDLTCLFVKKIKKSAGKSPTTATVKTMEDCKKEFSSLMADISDVQQHVEQLTENFLEKHKKKDEASKFMIY